MESGLWHPREEIPENFSDEAVIYQGRLLAAARRLLPEKPVFVIDIFDTFLPKRVRLPELSPEHIRDGFVEFLDTVA